MDPKVQKLRVTGIPYHGPPIHLTPTMLLAASILHVKGPRQPAEALALPNLETNLGAGTDSALALEVSWGCLRCRLHQAGPPLSCGRQWLLASPGPGGSGGSSDRLNAVLPRFQGNGHLTPATSSIQGLPTRQVAAVRPASVHMHSIWSSYNRASSQLTPSLHRGVN